jgi:two-component system, response regulator RegA
MSAHEGRRVLVVEDDPRLARTLRSALAPWASELRCARSVEEACVALVELEPELVVLDFRLPDGDARDVLKQMATSARSAPVVAISAYARPRESFDLAALGVRAFLEKPLDLVALEAAVSAALHTPPDLEVSLRQTVGLVPLREVEAGVRRVMVDEALNRTQGSRRGAARLLTISRQLLQHIVRTMLGGRR